MAIRIKNLENLSKLLETKEYVYKDLHLDLVKDSNFNQVNEKLIPLNDIKASFDKQAIYNSLRNLFTTKPGERFLFPKYGLDLTEYLFQPISAVVSDLIGNKIVAAVKLYEPRVELEKCVVTSDPENNRYLIDVIVFIPLFNTTDVINSVLDVKSESFVFLT